MVASDTARIKALGRKVKNYDNTARNGMKQIIIYNGLYAKFSQNGELKKKLLATGETVLAE